MRTLQLNHVALHVADLERSSKFYTEVLKLKPMPRPDFAFPGAWFRLGADQELHLIGERTTPVISHNRGNHWALMVDDMDAWEQYFREKEIPYLPRRRRLIYRVRNRPYPINTRWPRPHRPRQRVYRPH